MRVTAKEARVTSSTHFSWADWQYWREQGWSAARIARHVHLSPSRVNQIARRLGRTPANDPQYQKTRPGPRWSWDVTTESGAYTLGLLWGLASLTSPTTLLIRHRDKGRLEQLRDLLGLTSHIITGPSLAKPSRLKISRAADRQSILAVLDAQGWTPRQATVRSYPSHPALHHAAFIRAWAELHAAADRARSGRSPRRIPRLRIYGNTAFIHTMNTYITAATQLSRTPQKTSNHITRALYYTGSSVPTLLQWLYAGATIYYQPARDRLEHCL